MIDLLHNSHAATKFYDVNNLMEAKQIALWNATYKIESKTTSKSSTIFKRVSHINESLHRETDSLTSRNSEIEN